MRLTLIPTLLLALALSAPSVGCSKRKDDGKGKTAPAAKADPRAALGAAADPKVEVLAFVDYECPFCRANVAKLSAAIGKHGKVMRVRFYNLPLEVHPNSVVLAKGALAARAQGKWQAFYDGVLGKEPAKGKAVDRDAAIAGAATAGLDGKKFAAALDDKAVAAEIAADVALAAALGVTGTPSFIVNGALVQGAQGEQDWDKIVAGQVAQYDALAKEKAGKDGKGKVVHADLHWAMVQKNSPERAPVYKKHVIDGAAAPASPVPAKVKRKSGVVSAQIQPAGGGMGGVQIGQPVRIGEEAGDPSTVWRVSVRPDDPRQGADTAPVTMVIFADFECQFCKQLQGTLKNVRAKFGNDKLRVVFKHNPLPFHKQAMEAAEAAEAARAQGKFWPLHDLLFDNQDKLKGGIRGLAEKAGLDMGQFDNAMTAHGARGRIQADMEQAAALGARGTPNIFINGRKLVGAKDADTLLKAIEAASSEADKALKAGAVKADGYYEHAIGKGKLLDSLGSEATSIDTTGAPTRGPKGAAIHIVTFQDFQCPFCARLDPHIRAMEKEFPGRVKVTWMDFPLQKIHREARMLAEVGREAHAQGKFWEFHKAVMADQSSLIPPTLIKIAKSIGMSEKKLDKHMRAKKWAEAVAKSRKIGEDLGIKGTPTVYINGHKFTPQLGFSANTFRR